MYILAGMLFFNCDLAYLNNSDLLSMREKTKLCPLLFNISCFFGSIYI